ncbi:hypothetical protein RB597_002654 [Gaeumannomyces tritici]
MLHILGARRSWRLIGNVTIGSHLQLGPFSLGAIPTTTVALTNRYQLGSRPMATEATTPAAPASISDEPAGGQTILHDGKRYTTIREGLAFILVPEAAGGDAQKKKPKLATGADDLQSVFYNPIQQFNRDLSVLAIKAHGKQVMEKRTRDHQRRMDQFADKKRKRQERRGANRDAHGQEQGQEEDGADDAEPPRKLSKVSSDAAEPQEPAPAPVPASAEGEQASADSEALDAAQAAEARPKKGPLIKILDALSATGLRALRYAHELPFPTTVVSNDLLEAAVESIKLNVRHNKLEDKIFVNHGNAVGHMYTIVCDEMSKGAAATAAGGNARLLQQQAAARGQKYDVIDLDPYGTAATFLDAAVQAVRDDGGLLCVTCTDPGVWASNGYPEKCFALYGGVPLKGFHSHEAGLRLILHAVAASAARYGLAVEPLLSLSIDYYARVFVRVRRSPASVKFQAGRTMMVYNCDAGCGAWETQPLLRNKRTSSSKKGGGGGCNVFYKHGFAQGPSADKHCEHCNTRMHLAGPMYAGRLHSPEFVRAILDDLPAASPDVYGTTDRVRGMLTTALEEMMEPREGAAGAATADGAANGGGIAPASVELRDKLAAVEVKEDRLAELEPYPFFFSPSVLAKVVHCMTPDEDSIRSGLASLGYRVTRSHCKPGSVKTDAPWSAVWDVMREWVRQKAPVKDGSIRPGTAGHHIMVVKGGGGGGGAGAEGEKGAKKEVEGDDENKPKVNFGLRVGRGDGREKKLVRYQVNPRENWGPQAKATGI